MKNLINTLVLAALALTFAKSAFAQTAEECSVDWAYMQALTSSIAVGGSVPAIKIIAEDITKEFRCPTEIQAFSGILVSEIVDDALRVAVNMPPRLQQIASALTYFSSRGLVPSFEELDQLRSAIK